MPSLPPAQGLYDPAREHDACGVGFVADLVRPPSHLVVQKGIELLRRLAHRGATGADPESGDGAGILTRIPHLHYERALERLGVELPLAGDYGVAQVFLSRQSERARAQRRILEDVVRYHGQRVLGWRDVPVHVSAVGPTGRASMPSFAQLFVARLGPRQAFERVLYLIQKRAQHFAVERGVADDFYIASLSSRTIVHKGLMIPEKLEQLFPDLAAKDFESDFALVHSRFSTNTFPTWSRAHPYRRIAHNGEINTLSGNRNWMRSREASLASDAFGEHLQDFRPIIRPEGSDSSALDNLVDFLIAGGRSLAHVMMMLVPEAIGDGAPRPADVTGFYAYHSSLTEPWDGPAAVLFTDGKLLGGILDRNGLRPAKYVTTKSGYVVLASEYGVLDFADDDIEERGRLSPGGMFAVDLENKCILHDAELKARVAEQQPYATWVAEQRVTLTGWDPKEHATSAMPHELARRFGVTREDLRAVLVPMSEAGQEPTGSMGIDTPLAVLSLHPVHFARYFKQQFAEVTNPPIDPVRESLVMTLRTRLGRQLNLLGETPEHCHSIEIEHPLVSAAFVQLLLSQSLADFPAAALTAAFERPVSSPADLFEEPARRACGESLAAALHRLELDAAAAVEAGAAVLVLSDLELHDNQVPVPMLLAVSAVHNHLIERGLRTRVSLVLNTGFVREVHDLALCIGFGATAVCPRLALDLVSSEAERSGRDAAAARSHYVTALKKGLLKVMSKMGISTVQSYRGAQIFEAIGIARSVCDRYLGHVGSALSGIGLDEIAVEACRLADRGARVRAEAPRAETDVLPEGGMYAWRARGEKHLWSPDSVASLRSAVRLSSPSDYASYSRSIDDHGGAPVTLRGLFDFVPPQCAIPIEEVEPASEIVRRFSTGAMSYGSIGKEAHESLALAMNRIGGRSNTGEGGEDAARYQPDADGGSRRSAIKQVASARFGVTAHYLSNADEIQIKIAQGAKPGEGGQLPGHKVDAVIARLRHSTPGITLVSPPPHHDIYSIEDLAQLIFDLKTVNPRAMVSVKLVSQSGVGTVAAGVAKAGADAIVIAGHDGGTGASPLSSIQHAGTPWELGLAETQQTLLLNDLRGRVELEVDGQLKTGRDVVIGALLGAERFGFATAPLVALGCIMMRKCHLNTCPVGIATQDPILRARFRGAPEHVVNYFFFVAEEVRALMARLGARSFAELVGHTELLTARPLAQHPKAHTLDLAAILAVPEFAKRGARGSNKRADGSSRACTPAPSKLEGLAAGSLAERTPTRFSVRLENRDRAFGADLAGAIARRYGPLGVDDDTIVIDAKGTAGQSFGAFAAHGMSLTLEGSANDYVGKGLSGGVLVVRPAAPLRPLAHTHAIVGNTVLYGATSGRAFFAGLAGERFAVRNSGASAVIEGVGDHGCEYMTGGTVVVLGSVGRNFAAGLSGGAVFALDLSETTTLGEPSLLRDPLSLEDEAELLGLLREHASRALSVRAAELLRDWPLAKTRFCKIWAAEYKAIALAAKATEVPQNG